MFEESKSKNVTIPTFGLASLERIQSGIKTEASAIHAEGAKNRGFYRGLGGPFEALGQRNESPRGEVLLTATRAHPFLIKDWTQDDENGAHIPIS